MNDKLKQTKTKNKKKEKKTQKKKKHEKCVYSVPEFIREKNDTKKQIVSERNVIHVRFYVGWTIFVWIIFIYFSVLSFALLKKADLPQFVSCFVFYFIDSIWSKINEEKYIHKLIIGNFDCFWFSSFFPIQFYYFYKAIRWQRSFNLNIIFWL